MPPPHQVEVLGDDQVLCLSLSPCKGIQMVLITVNCPSMHNFSEYNFAVTTEGCPNYSNIFYEHLIASVIITHNRQN